MNVYKHIQDIASFPVTHKYRHIMTAGFHVERGDCTHLWL